MKKSITIYLVFALLIMALPILADEPPNPGGDPSGGGSPVGGGSPLGGGLFTLLGLGISYAYYRYKSLKRN